MKIGRYELAPLAKALWKDFREDDVQGLAAQVAYNILFSVVPLLIFLTAMSGFISRLVGVNDAMASITEWLFKNLPDDAANALRDPIESVIANQSGGVLSLGAVLALWGGKNAMASLMKALNVAFDVKETRPWLKKTGIAMGLTVALGLAIVAASAFFLAGSFVGEAFANMVGLGDTWTTVWSILRWPLIVLILVVALAFFYWAGPNVNAPFKWFTPGSIIAVLLWGIATFGLSIYFERFGGYNKTYGALGGVLAFVFWIYVMSVILLLGGELNSVATRLAGVADPDAEPLPAGGDGAASHAAAASAAVATTTSGGKREALVPPPRPAIGTSVPWPSAERLARQALTIEGSAGRDRRSKRSLRALVFAVVAAVSAALFGAGRGRR